MSNTSSHTWKVVKFCSTENGSECVEAVPTSWIVDNFCYWPSLTKSDATKAIKTCWSPDKVQWQKLEVNVLSTTSYSSFSQASRKATKAILKSDIDTTDVDELPSKRRKKVVKCSSSEENENSDSSVPDDDVPNYPVPPSKESLTKQNPMGKTTLRNSQRNIIKAAYTTQRVLQEQNSNSTTESYEYVVNDQQTLPNNVPEYDITVRGAVTTATTAQAASSSVVHKINELTRLLVKNNVLIKEQNKHIERLENKLDTLIQEKSNLNTTTAFDMNEDIEKITNLFPLKTIEELDNLEELIKCNGTNMEENKKKEDTRIHLAQYLSREGSSNYKEAVRRIMSAVMTDELAIIFSYKGHKGKRKFCITTLSTVVISAVQLCCSKKSDLLKKNIENELSVWLSKAKERMKSSKKPGDHTVPPSSIQDAVPPSVLM